MSGTDDLKDITAKIRQELAAFDEALTQAQDQLFALTTTREIIGSELERLDRCAERIDSEARADDDDVKIPRQFLHDAHSIGDVERRVRYLLQTGSDGLLR